MPRSTINRLSRTSHRAPARRPGLVRQRGTGGGGDIECVDRDPEVFDLWLDPYEREPRTPDRDDVAVLVPALERLGPTAPAAPGILDRDTEGRLRALGYLQ